MYKHGSIKPLIAVLLVLAMSVGMLTSLGGKAEAATTYKVQFFANGGQNCKNGTKDLTKSYTSGSYTTMPNYYTKSGYTFTGWMLNNGSKKVYKAGECVEVKSGMQFIAQWTKGNGIECGHNLVGSNSITKSPTCTQPGERTYKCMVCNNVWKKAIPKNGHNFGEIKTDPAYCEKDGREYKVCKTCGYLQQVRYISHTGHNYSIVVGSKDGDVIKLKCSKCGGYANRESNPKNLDDFAYYIFKKNYDSLNKTGLWFWTTDKEECTAKWLSYMTGMTYKQAKETCKAFSGDYNEITINDINALTKFIGKCNKVASKYGFSYAGAISAALSKFSLALCMVNPNVSVYDKALRIVGIIAPTSVKIVKQYEKHFNTMYNAMKGLTEDNYSKCFEALMEIYIVPHFGTDRPSYEQLFGKDGDDSAGIDWICKMISNNKVDFAGMCASVNSGKLTYLLDYKCLVKFIITPAQDAEVQKCFSGYTTDYQDGKPKGETAIEKILKWVYDQI